VCEALCVCLVGVLRLAVRSCRRPPCRVQQRRQVHDAQGAVLLPGSAACRWPRQTN